MSQPKTKKKPAFRPLRAVVQLHGVYTDPEGNVLGEAPLDPFPLSPAQFGDLERMVKEAWPEVEARFLAQQNGHQEQ
jgi:hypothetical protein